jgi:sulfate permease, SulP family
MRSALILHRIRELRLARLRDDLSGGLASAAVAIPLAMGYGMFAFSALGDSYFAYGALAGLYAAVLGGIVCVVLGDRTTMIFAPRVTTTFFLGALLHNLLGANVEGLRDGGLHVAILAFFAIILLGGALQALFGMMRLGSLLRFTPHPVMAGLQNAAAALLFLVQLGNVCGFENNIPFTAVTKHLAEVKTLSIAVALVTFLAMWNARRITTKIPPLLVGIGVGTAVFFAIEAAGFGAYLGPVIGMPGTAESPAPFNHLESRAEALDLFGFLPLIVGGAFALAIVAALDTLLCAKLALPPNKQKEDGNRLLIRLGLSNMASACFGGITTGINIGPSIVNRTFGAKSALSVLINVAVVLVVILVLFPVVSYMPRVVLSAAIMVIAVQHIDPWSVDLVRRIGAAASRRRMLMVLDLLVVAAVAVLSVTINIVLAVFIGIVIAIVLFIARASRSNIRRMYRCDTIRSRKARGKRQMALLDMEGAQVLVLELQGVLFFGSAETLSEEIGRLASSGTRTVILDLRRVTEIDATGMRILREIELSLARDHQQLVLALPEGSELAPRLAEAGIVDEIGREHLFADVDRAMEWAEDDLLQIDANDAEGDELPLAQIDLFSSLAGTEIAMLGGYMRRATYPGGSVIFRQGDAGKELFIITRGHASARLGQAAGGDIRLATFAPGTFFGELAILDAGPRSATVMADEDVRCHVLSDAKFSALMSDAPLVAIRLLANLGRELSGRLRRANRTIHQLES